VAYAKQAGFYRAEKEELLARDGVVSKTGVKIASHSSTPHER